MKYGFHYIVRDSIPPQMKVRVLIM